MKKKVLLSTVMMTIVFMLSSVSCFAQSIGQTFTVSQCAKVVRTNGTTEYVDMNFKVTGVDPATVEIYYRSYSSISNFGTFKTLEIPQYVIYNNQGYWVTSVGFMGSSQTTSITDAKIDLQEIVEIISKDAFGHYNHVKEIAGTDALIKIERFGFGDNRRLQIIDLSKVEEIGDSAFINCDSLHSVDLTNIRKLGKAAFLIGQNSPKYGLTDLVLGEQLESIPYRCFRNNRGLKSVRIPGNSKIIGEQAFMNCEALENLVIDPGVEEIGIRAFAGCKLRSVKIPEGVTAIGEHAFSTGSVQNRLFEIPSSITTIGEDAFYNDNDSSVDTLYVHATTPPVCTNSLGNKLVVFVPKGCRAAYLTADVWKDVYNIVEFSPTITFADAKVKALCLANWDTDGDGKFTEEEATAVTDLGEVFKENTEITSFNELQYFTSLSSITSNTFYGCRGLASITIPSNVTSIENGAFRYCDVLTSIIVDSGNATYDSRNGCNAIIETATNTLIAGCKSTIIPNNVTSISYHAFYGCTGLTSITIPNSVTSIGYYVFYDCELSSVFIPSNLTTINRQIFVGAMVESVVVDGDNTVYDSRNNCNAIIETASNTLIVGCKNTVIPNSVIKIGTEAFAGCRGLINLIIPEGVEVIGGCVFLGSSDLISISIPTSVKQFLRGSWIDNDSHLETVFMYGKTPITIYETTFVNRANATLYVPAGCKAAYESANYWRQFHEIIEMDPILATNLTLDITTLTLSTAGQTEMLTATILPSIATDMTVTWTSSNTNVATVDANGTVTAVANGTTTITATTNDGTNLTATCEVIVVTEVFGDANGDGTVNVTDYLSVANYILGFNTTDFDETAADVNGDGTVNVSDYVGVANIILYGNYQGPSVNSMMALKADEASTWMEMEPTEDRKMNMLLHDAKPFSAFQMDIQLPEGVEIVDASMAKANQTKNLGFTKLQNGTWRLLYGTMNNTTVNLVDNCLLTLELAGGKSNNGGCVTVDQILLVKSNASAVLLNAVQGGMPTGIYAIESGSSIDRDCYDLIGRKVDNSQLKKGVYVVNGKKMYVK